MIVPYDEKEGNARILRHLFQSQRSCQFRTQEEYALIGFPATALYTSAYNKDL